MEVKTRTVKQGLLHRVPQWKLGYLEVVENEAKKFLNAEQYSHAVNLFNDLACESNPAQSEAQDIRKIDDFYELRDKGGILGKINLRVYFTIIEERKLILVLVAYKKEDDGQVPRHIKTRVRNRLRIVKGEMAGT